jgi:hypothetical protein
MNVKKLETVLSLINESQLELSSKLKALTASPNQNQLWPRTMRNEFTRLNELADNMNVYVKDLNKEVHFIMMSRRKQSRKRQLSVEKSDNENVKLKMKRAVSPIQAISMSQEETNQDDLQNRIPKFHDLKTLFITWYKDRLYDADINDTETRSEFRKLSKTIAYLKRFLPDNTAIELPNENDIDSFQLWQQKIDELGDTAQRSAMKFIKDYYDNQDDTKMKLGRSALNKASVWNNYKRLHSIPLHVFPKPSNVFDHITPINPFTYIDIEAFRKH